MFDIATAQGICLVVYFGLFGIFSSKCGVLLGVFRTRFLVELQFLWHILPAMSLRAINLHFRY